MSEPPDELNTSGSERIPYDASVKELHFIQTIDAETGRVIKLEEIDTESGTRPVKEQHFIQSIEVATGRILKLEEVDAGTGEKREVAAGPPFPPSSPFYAYDPYGYQGYLPPPWPSWVGDPEIRDSVPTPEEIATSSFARRFCCHSKWSAQQ